MVVAMVLRNDAVVVEVVAVEVGRGGNPFIVQPLSVRTGVDVGWDGMVRDTVVGFENANDSATPLPTTGSCTADCLLWLVAILLLLLEADDDGGVKSLPVVSENSCEGEAS